MHPEVLEAVLFAVLLAVVVVGHLATQRLLRNRDKVLYAQHKAVAREVALAQQEIERVRDQAGENYERIRQVMADPRVARLLNKRQLPEA
jgi:hypothetical protein